MSLESEFRGMVRELLREVVREELGARPTELQEELLTYAEAHKRFKLSPRTLSRWVSAGRLRAFGKGKLRRVRADDVRTCLEQEKAPQAAQPPAEVEVKNKVTSILASLPRRAR